MKLAVGQFLYGFRLMQFNWQSAKMTLSRALEVHTVGYSLPQADFVSSIL